MRIPPLTDLTKWELTTDSLTVRRMGKTGEECAELLAVTARIAIQGIDEIDPASQKTNRQRLLEEVADVYAQLDSNVAMLGLDSEFIQARRATKVERMCQWEAMYRPGFDAAGYQDHNHFTIGTHAPEGMHAPDPKCPACGGAGMVGVFHCICRLREERSISAGWKLAPMQTTDAMEQAAFEAAGSPSDWYGLQEMWTAALAAVPAAAPPEAEGRVALQAVGVIQRVLCAGDDAGDFVHDDELRRDLVSAQAWLLRTFALSSHRPGPGVWACESAPGVFNASVRWTLNDPEAIHG